MCVCVCIYIYIFVCVCVCVGIYIYIYIYTHRGIHLCQTFKFNKRGVSVAQSTLLYFTLLKKTRKSFCVIGVPILYNFSV
jgi:hypothetical protein